MGDEEGLAGMDGMDGMDGMGHGAVGSGQSSVFKKTKKPAIRCTDGRFYISGKYRLIGFDPDLRMGIMRL